MIRSGHAFLAGVLALGLLTTSTARADRFSASAGGDMGDGSSGDYWASSGGYGFGTGLPGGSPWPCATLGFCDTWGAEIQFDYDAFVDTTIKFVDIVFATPGPAPATPTPGSGNCDVTSGAFLAAGTGTADIMCSFNSAALSMNTAYYIFLQPSCSATNCLDDPNAPSDSDAKLIVGPLTSNSPVPEPASIVLGLTVMAMIALGGRKLLPRR